MTGMEHGDDPNNFVMSDVLDHLAQTLDPAETARVLAAERAGAARKGILEPLNGREIVDYSDANAEAEEQARQAEAGSDAEAMGYTLVDVTEAANNPPPAEDA